MIDRKGQVWEDGNEALCYVVLETRAFPHRADMWHHKIMFLISTVPGYVPGETATDHELAHNPWEKSTRRRLA